MQLVLDHETHVYTLNGKRVPSVTQVLAPMNDYSMVPFDILEAARIFGQHVHEAVDLFNRGTLDLTWLDLPLVPFVSAWSKFLEESGAVVIASEMPVAHERLGYAGTPDLVLVRGKRRRFVVPDVKATAVIPPTVGLQTAAYAKAYASMHDVLEPERYCIHLRDDGTYRCDKRTDPSDWPYFQSALNCHLWKENHRVRLTA